MWRKTTIAIAITLTFSATMPVTTALARGGGGHMGGGMGVAHFGVGGLGMRARPPIPPQQVLRQQAISPAPPPQSLQGPPSISAPFAGN
jgi:hypothetical protein